MTTSRYLSGMRARRRLVAHWPALVLPLLAAETFGIASHAQLLPFLLLAGAMVVTLGSPAHAARIAPYAMLGYGWFGFFLLHSVLKQQTGGNPVLLSPSGAAWYGLFPVRLLGTSMLIVLPEVFFFLIAGLWLLTVTGAPGAGPVRRAARQLRGTGGQPRTVPPLLLVPVVILWEEALSGTLWFTSPFMIAFAVGFVLAAAAMARRLPVLASVTAVLGIVLYGIFIAYMAVKWSDPFAGLLSAFYGIVVLYNPLGRGLVLVEGFSFLLAGLVLAPRLLSVAADAELARRAEALAQRVSRLTETRSDAAEVAVAELRRIERDLHDGAQARLVAVGMSLRAAERLMLASPETALALVAEARETSSRALADLRDLVRGIYPPVLADRGLADAVRALALDAPLPATVDVDLPGEAPMPVAAAAYFGVAEALANAVGHSGASLVQVSVRYGGGTLRVSVIDDGSGGADASLGTGLAGLERRLAAFDGILAISSPPGGPTVVAIEIPCALSSDGPPRSA